MLNLSHNLSGVVTATTDSISTNTFEFSYLENIIVPFGVALLTCIFSFIIMKRQIIKELDAKQKFTLYEIKKETIFDVLTFLDTYYSWLDTNEKTIRENITTEELTLNGRKYYNKLCVTVNSQRLVDIFNELMFCNPQHPILLINEFREEARKELGLSKIKLSEDHIFIARIGTIPLKSHESKSINN